MAVLLNMSNIPNRSLFSHFITAGITIIIYSYLFSGPSTPVKSERPDKQDVEVPHQVPIHYESSTKLGVNLVNSNVPAYKNIYESNCVKTTCTPDFYVCLFPREHDQQISGYILDERVYETHVLINFDRALQKYPDALVINLGANLGFFSLFAAKRGHQVIAVEPQEQCMLRLYMSTLMNSLQDKIYLVQNAITDRQGQTVYFKPNKPNSKSIDDQGGMQARILKDGDNPPKDVQLAQSITVDNLLKVASFKTSILFMDIEGYECTALAGAQNYLDKVFVPFIFMEWSLHFYSQEGYHAPCSIQEMGKLVAELTRRKYKPYSHYFNKPLDPLKWKDWEKNEDVKEEYRMEVLWKHESATAIF